MKKIKKLVITLLLGALTLSVFAFTGCKTPEEQASSEPDVGIAVLTSYTETTSEGQTCLVKELIATVSGISSSMQPIDLLWEAEIPPLINATTENPIKGDAVNNYLLLEPSTYDSNNKTSVCKIKLIAPIKNGGVINVKVKCKNNNIESLCKVKYNSEPRSIEVVCNDELNLFLDETVPGENPHDKNICQLIAGNTYTWNITSLDAFDQPVEGPVKATLAYEGARGEFTLENGNSYTLDDFINVADSNYTEYFSYTFSPEDGRLIIEAKNSLENLKIRDTSNGSTYYGFSKYAEYEPYFMFTLTWVDKVEVSHDYYIKIRVVDQLSIKLNNKNIVFS